MEGLPAYLTRLDTGRLAYVFQPGKDSNLCQVKFCRHNRVLKRKTCWKCKKRLWRLNNPEKTAYSNVRDSARGRNIEFDLDYEWFLEWCAETSYIKFKGRRGFDFHVDRIDPTKGYTHDNIQILTATENVTKANKGRRRTPVKEYDTIGPDNPF